MHAAVTTEWRATIRPRSRWGIGRWGGIAAAAVVVVVGVFIYLNHERTVRQAALHAAMQIQNANIGPSQNEFVLSFTVIPFAVRPDASCTKDVTAW